MGWPCCTFQQILLHDPTQRIEGLVLQISGILEQVGRYLRLRLSFFGLRASIAATAVLSLLLLLLSLLLLKPFLLISLAPTRIFLVSIPEHASYFDIVDALHLFPFTNAITLIEFLALAAPILK